jgi:hypothetical protein
MKTARMNASLIALAAGLAAAAPALAQMAPPPSREVKWTADSGAVRAKGGQGAQLVYTTMVMVPRSGWLRLAFDAVELSGRVEEGTGAYLVITSLADGAEQYLNARTAAEWVNTSAYFNGDAVRVDLMAFPGQAPSRVAIRSVTAGLPPVGGPDSICGPTDDRILSFDNRGARHSIGCTSWLISDTNHQFLTAGHCGAAAGSVMSFNVPLSTSTGMLVQSAPQDQYVVDTASVQGNGGIGVGNDYCYFGVLPNSNTGLMPAQAYGSWYTIIQPPPLAAGQIIRITGYGVVSSPVSPTWNQVQKTHTGNRVTPVQGQTSTAVAYTTDTTGGNSGSPVILESSPPAGTIAIGIHTHGYCTSTSGENYGTGLNLPAVQTALNNPTGACKTGRGTPGGPLYVIGDSVNNFGTASTTTGNFARIAAEPPRMEGLTYNRNAGVFYGVSNDTYGVPPGPAGRKLWSIDPSTGAATYIANISGAAGVINGLGYNPTTNILYGVIQATGTRVVINTTTGVATIDGVNNGGSIGGLEYDPSTDTLFGIDDGGGASRLVRFTPDTGAAIIVGALGAGIADCNGLAVTDDGMLWTINAATEQLLRVNPATGVATVIGPTNGQFGASFGMAAVLTGTPCYANCDGSTQLPVLNVNDFVCFQNRFAAADPYADCDHNSSLNVNDFVCFQNQFAAGCP